MTCDNLKKYGFILLFDASEVGGGRFKFDDEIDDEMVAITKREFKRLKGLKRQYWRTQGRA